MNNKKTSLSLAILSLAGLVDAGTINWGGAYFTTNYSADGTLLEVGASTGSATGQVMYELGVFQNADGTEYNPSFANASEWGDRWVPLATNNFSLAAASSDYDAGDKVFGNVISFGALAEQVETVGSATNGGVVVHGFQAYIWGFDTKDITDGQAEWFLVTGKESGATGSTGNNWVIPDSSASNNGTFDLQWDIASSSLAIVGQINNNKGGGEMTDPNDPFGPSDHQFATVPEPSSSVLGLLATLALLRRKR